MLSLCKLTNKFMNKKILAVLIVVVSLITYVIVYNCCIVSEEVEEVIPEVVEEIIPLNYLIESDMSDFEETAGFDSDLERFMKRWEVVGASFALMRGDSLLYAKGYGYSDIEGEVLCDVSNVFRVASVSKLLTATAVMKLVEEGKLSLQSKVFGQDGIFCDSTFVDLRYRNTEKITVEHLLRHTAGFSTRAGDPAFANSLVARALGKELPVTTEDMVRYATLYPTKWVPGSSYSYSNLGYIVLGEVIERVSGVSYEGYICDSILAPLGINDIFLGRNFSVNCAPNEVKYYEVKEADTIEAYDGTGRMTMRSDGGNNVTLLGGAGGWVASPVELLRFVASIDGCPVIEDILSPESVEIMTASDDEIAPIGWASTDGEQWIRTGSMAGTTAIIKKQRDGYTWVFLTNKSPWIAYKLNNYASVYISKAIAKVKEWPVQNLFDTIQQ